MRRLTICLCSVFALTGCTNWGFIRNPTPDVPARPASNEKPSAAALLGYMQQSADRLNGLEVRNLDLECRQAGQSASLDAWMVCRKGKDFRLGGKSLAGPEVDLGSNGEEFWFWVKRANPDHVFHCAYSDLSQGNVRMPFPFKPDYVLEAIGMSVTGTPETCDVQMQGKNIELIEKAVGPQGQPLRKVTVFQRNAVLPPEPQITARILQNAQGRTIASATIQQVAFDPTSKAIYPTKMRIEYPEEKLELRLLIDANRVKVNPEWSDERVADLFTRRGLAHLKPVDLARGPQAQPTAAAVQPAGGYQR